jgi:hypothetical protein
MDHATTHSVLFPDLFAKPLQVCFDEPHITSNGGAIHVKAVDERLQLTQRLADCIVDPRQGGKVQHSIVDLVRQRAFALACGYPDANDVAAIGHDPMFKLLLERHPFAGEDLASQPTISRFENACSVKDLFRMGETMMETVIEHHRRRLPGRKCKRVTIDLDPTDDQAHGAQQLALFNGHYGGYCFLTLLGNLTFNQEAEQYLFAAILRPGTVHGKVGTLGLLRRAIPLLRLAFPFAQVRVRLDGGFACEEVFQLLEEQEVEFLAAIAGNRTLRRRSRRLMARARRLARRRKRTVTLYGETVYVARTWKQSRRVIFKAEVVYLEGRGLRDNCRYAVTNLAFIPETVYALYRKRGDQENRIKELKSSMHIDRTSCTRFWANQLRVLLTAAAYMLLQELRRLLHPAKLARGQVETLRVQLLKIGGRVRVTARRTVIHLSATHPWREEWIRAGRLLGGVAT